MTHILCRRLYSDCSHSIWERYADFVGWFAMFFSTAPPHDNHWWRKQHFCRIWFAHQVVRTFLCIPPSAGIITHCGMCSATTTPQWRSLGDVRVCNRCFCASSKITCGCGVKSTVGHWRKWEVDSSPLSCLYAFHTVMPALHLITWFRADGAATTATCPNVCLLCLPDDYM